MRARPQSRRRCAAASRSRSGCACRRCSTPSAARGKGAQRVEFEAVPVDRWYEAVVTPIAAVEPSAGLVLMTLYDLTPLRRVEEMRADFVANASHELRTPLAALSGFIETLQGPARDDPAARERFLKIMQAQANRMARLIDDLLSLSRIELNAHLRPDKHADLVAILRQVADGLQTLARDRAVDVRLSMPASPLLVLGDRDELLRVFENLVENALKYAPPASGSRSRWRPAPPPAARPRPASRCATMVPASPPSTCRG